MTKSMSAVAMARPAMITVPTAMRLSAPAPEAVTSGTAPRMVEIAVIMMGLRRRTEASITASRTS